MIFTVVAEAKEFEQIISGEKPFAILRKREDVKIGDLLAINEENPDGNGYTGRCCLVYIDHIEDTQGLEAEYNAIGFKPCILFKASEPFDRMKLTHDYSVQAINRENPQIL